MELVCSEERIALPRSKKCRALLGYLAVTGRAHRRDRLCDLFWDVADDPRGGLRWTLSRLRSVLPDGKEVLQTDRESVQLCQDSLSVDATRLAALDGTDLSEVPTPRLQQLAAQYRGELLEGLELTDFLDFTAWCVAEREELRRTQCAVLKELVDRFPDERAAALPWARMWAQIDAFDARVQETLLALLLSEGYAEEAERRYEHALRQFQQMAVPEADALKRAWHALRSRDAAPRPPTPLATEPASAPPPVRAAEPPAPRPGVRRDLDLDLDAAPAPFVGRQRPLARVGEVLESVRADGARAAVLIEGEPGAGKSRLLERIRSDALHAGFEVLSARAFDLERGRPFGPWIDALDVAPDELAETAEAGGRERLFERLASLVAARSANGGGVVLVFDDVQWLDRDSAEALHHLLRTHGDGPLLALLAARNGELSDNAAMESVLRSLQHDRLLHEVELDPLSRDEVVALLGEQDEAHVERIMQASAGNPLYALELSRGTRQGAASTPPSLVQLVRERVSRLSDAAEDVLRWAAVLGYTFDAARLEALSELSPVELVGALEELERHALLRIDASRSSERYAFSHDVVREAAYGELSHPRKRLMHRKVAHLMQAHANDPATAYEVARHASLAGEVSLGVRACIAAARYALRSCANSDAEALARRGLHHAEELDEAERVAASLDLLHVLYSARAPDHDEATRRVHALAERALDLGLTKPARIGFQMLSYLRWESASMKDAHENILQAERISRVAEPEERSQALAHAARCLVLLERNLGQAEAFMLEAQGVTQRGGRSNAAVAFGLAMISAHRGEHEVAEAAFREAQDLARAGGERLAEFGALEHRVMLALDGHGGDAVELSQQLCQLASRVRPGAEVAIAGALRALAAVVGGDDGEAALRDAITTLREADAKYELSFVLTRWAIHALRRGDLERAAEVAAEAQTVAHAVGRTSEGVIAASVMALVGQQRPTETGAVPPHAELTGAAEADLSAMARQMLNEVRGASR
jgi:DNA-binding SARP family transcriptional activator